MTPRDLSGAAVAVVGASGALGSRVAQRLQDAGARLLLVGRDEQKLTALGLDAPTVHADLVDPRTFDGVAEAAREQLGGLDGVVNAAGVVAFGPLVDTPDDTLELLFRVNVFGPLLLLRRLLPLVAERQGFVAQLSAVVAERGVAGMVGYSATKGALSTALTALRGEVRRQGVDIIDLRPPHTETGLADRAVAGTAPQLPTGLSPDAVAERVVGAIRDREREVGSGDFGG